ncbi:MAG: hemolysin family protein [Flavobacteriales bacterium]
MNALIFILLAMSILLSAFFSGVEIAFVSSNKLKFELDKKQRHFGARLLSPAFSNPQRFIGSLLIGNNAAIVIYGIIMAGLLEPFIRRFSHSDILILLLQTLISTAFILVFAEFLPKIIFRINPNRTLHFFSVPIAFFYYLLLIPVIIITGISEFFLKYILRVRFTKIKPVFRRIDLDHYLEDVSTIAQTRDEELDTEIQIFRNALDFSSVKARECMVPRNEIIAVNVEDPIDDLREQFIRTGLSKILIYRDSIDNIIGYTHSYELFTKPDNIKNIILPASVIPESMPAGEILKLFIKNKRSMAVVLDEFGGTAGIVTTEDVLEELFGEIQDEHDTEDLTERRISDSSFEFSARLEVDYINEKYKLGLPESVDYETLAGLIYQHHQSIPQAGEKISIADFEFVIRRVDRNRIDLVTVICH